MKAQEIREKLENQEIGELDHFGLTTYAVRMGTDEWSVCDNGEEVICRSVEEAVRVIQENLA